MVSLYPTLATLYTLCIWIVKFAEGCPDLWTPMNGRCCKQCPPGQYLEEFCAEKKETVCRPCPDNSFSPQHNAFNKCMQCNSCRGAHREHEELCSPTTNAKCSCHPGFLCSDDACSQCVENICDAGEKAVKTGSAAGLRPYKCQPACPDHEYLDMKMNICRPKLQCKKEGLVEQFPGNRTHDAVCHKRSELRPDSSPDTDRDALCVTWRIGCVLLALILLVVLSLNSIKVAKNCRADKTTAATPVTVDDSQLSKEESGLQRLITQTDSNKSQLQEIVTTLQ
ncbi:tumor necrosis factor receptor superfamily member 18 [Phyllopteryx taeniolatus]|uniref:tumor necrosis factor receptor superfamily member 18 n=1 Tax=Phyllopteryx taeniolatus TaxID=161469 RepID=UPI002AD3B588|nr:tumor necrosis factor receptor superfamily member 18 [Phyllopteryx taeniolatus]